jgi:hypothetical protein
MFEEELALRATVVRLRSQQIKLTKTLAAKHRKPHELASSPDTDTNLVLETHADTPGSRNSDLKEGDKSENTKLATVINR